MIIFHDQPALISAWLINQTWQKDWRLLWTSFCLITWQIVGIISIGHILSIYCIFSCLILPCHLYLYCMNTVVQHIFLLMDGKLQDALHKTPTSITNIKPQLRYVNSLLWFFIFSFIYFSYPKITIFFHFYVQKWDPCSASKPWAWFQVLIVISPLSIR